MKLLDTPNTSNPIESFTVDYINNNINEIINLPIDKIANKIGINQSTLSRIIRRIGFTDFKSFRNHLIQKSSEYKMFKEQNSPSSLHQMLDELENSNRFAVKETIKELNTPAFEKILNIINDAKRIYWYGIGFSGYICNQINKYLIFYNKNSVFVESFYDSMKIIDNKFEANTVWVIISKSLTTKEITFIINQLKLKNITLIIVTANTYSDLLENINYVIKLKTLFNDDDVFSLSSKTSALVVSNAIINGLSLINHYDQLEKIGSFGKLTKLWKTYKG